MDRPAKSHQCHIRVPASLEKCLSLIGENVESDLKEIPVDVLTGGGELLLLWCGQQFVNVLHTSSLCSKYKLIENG